VELLGELSAFVDGIVPLYKHVNSNEVRLVLLQGANRIMPEIDSALADYGARVLAARPGVEVRTNIRVQAIGPHTVHMANETIAADTIVLAAGVVPSPVVAALQIAKDKSGRILVESTMRNREHAEVWALGDCASIPGPDDTPYPALAQHAMREAKVLAQNIGRVLTGELPKPFIHDNLGMMGSLGHNMGFAQFLKLRMRGLPAWFARRTYYLLQMPGWSRRLRMIIDWMFGLLFRPDVVKVGLDTETASLLREVAIRDTGSRLLDKSGTPSGTRAINRSLGASQNASPWYTHRRSSALWRVHHGSHAWLLTPFLICCAQHWHRTMTLGGGTSNRASKTFVR
jgi:NADH:ubiquinone reductase (H+-translocating)